MQKKGDSIKKSPLPQVGIEPTTYGFSERRIVPYGLSLSLYQ